MEPECFREEECKNPKGLGLFRRLLEGRGRGLMKGAKSRHLGKLSEVAEFQVVAARVFKSGGSLVLLCSL